MGSDSAWAFSDRLRNVTVNCVSGSFEVQHVLGDGYSEVCVGESHSKRCFGDCHSNMFLGDCYSGVYLGD